MKKTLGTEGNRLSELIGNAFATHRRDWIKTGHEPIDRLFQQVSYRSGATKVLEEAEAYMAERGLAFSEVTSWSELSALAEFCEQNPHPDPSDDPRSIAGPEYYLPRVYFHHHAYRLATMRYLRASMDPNAKDVWSDFEQIRAHAFELGAICREYQLNRDNALDALDRKRTVARLSERRHSGNDQRRAAADRWRMPMRVEAQRRWESNPKPSSSQMARDLRRWLVNLLNEFDETTAPKSDTIRKEIGDLRPKGK